MNFSKLCLRLVMICALTFLVPKQSLIAAAKPKPIWNVDLKKYAFRGPRLGIVDDPGSLANIAFSKNTVAVLFNERTEEIPQNRTKGKKWTVWRLASVFLDAKTGALIAKRQWLVDIPWPTQIFPTVSGNFVFLVSRIREPMEVPWGSKDIRGAYDRHQTELLVVSPTGEELRRVTLPLRETSKDDYWRALMSPSGTSLLLTHPGVDSCEFVLLDTDTLTQRSVWIQSHVAGCQAVAISDEKVLLDEGSKKGLIGKFGSPLSGIDLPYGHSRFLTDDLFVNFAIPFGPATIMTSTGNRVAAFNLGINDPGPHGVRPGITPPFASSNGRRFGTVIDQLAGPAFFRRDQRTLYVWQEPENTLVFETPLKYSIIQGAEVMLSNDGSHLAVVNARKVSMYELPVN